MGNEADAQWIQTQRDGARILEQRAKELERRKAENAAKAAKAKKKEK